MCLQIFLKRKRNEEDTPLAADPEASTEQQEAEEQAAVRQRTGLSSSDEEDLDVEA